MNEPTRSSPLRLLAWLVLLLALGAGQGAASVREARSESKSVHAAARLHVARLPVGRSLPDPLGPFALPAPGPELPPAPEVPSPAPLLPHPAAPAQAVCRAEYPRGPPA